MVTTTITMLLRHSRKHIRAEDSHIMVLLMKSFHSQTVRSIFVKGEPELPLTVYINKLNSWTEFGAAYEKLSGTAEYSTTLPLLPHQFNAWLLGLNKMYESATIYLNNNCLGTFINPPYEMVIPPEVSIDNNKLEIAIPNLLVNHIIHLDKEGVQWKKFYNTNINARRYENRDENGWFTARNQVPKASGITAPVTLTGVIMKH